MTRTRHDVATLTHRDVADAQTQQWHPVLDTYARGVEAMRVLPADDPASWLWAANTHGAPPGTPPRPAWGQCAHASLFFLPWHRAYLAWFESTVRSLTGDHDWGLPYWDYSDPDDPDAAFLPAEFRAPTRTVDGAVVDNPLFDPARSGSPIPADDADLVPALRESRYVGRVPDVGFGGTDRERRFGDVVKISHHGSHNGTYDELLDDLMPPQSPDGRERHALVSTHDGDWDSVPDVGGTLSLYRQPRCTLHDTRTVALGASLEIRFPGSAGPSLDDQHRPPPTLQEEL